MDVEFLAQALQLTHLDAKTTDPCTRVALDRLWRAGLLADGERLIEADRVWRAVQGLLRITAGRTVPQTLPDATRALVMRALDRICGPDESSVEARLGRVATDVSAAFAAHIGGR